jgi:hypothetical protein
MSRFGGLGLSFGRLGAGSGAGTGAAPDGDAPTVSSFSPLDNATDVAVDTDLIVTFNETVVLGAVGVVTLKKTSDNSTLDSWNVASDEGSGAGQLEVIGGNALHLHLSASVANSTEMYVIWDEGVVEDGSANPVAALAVTTTWSFTTEAAPAVNLLTQPSAFEHADWTKLNATIGVNAGGGTADELIEDGTNGYHAVIQSVTKAASAISYDFSVKCKLSADPRSRIAFQIDDGVDDGLQVAIDVANGLAAGSAVTEFGSSFTPGTSAITSLGSGWYLCQLNGFTTGTETTVRVVIALDAGGTTDAFAASYAGSTASMYIDEASLTVAA